MKTQLEELLKTVATAVETLKADSVEKSFTPQLGTALGGLRTAREGIEAHLTFNKPLPAPVNQVK